MKNGFFSSFDLSIHHSRGHDDVGVAHFSNAHLEELGDVEGDREQNGQAQQILFPHKKKKKGDF